MAPGVDSQVDQVLDVHLHNSLLLKEKHAFCSFNSESGVLMMAHNLQTLLSSKPFNPYSLYQQFEFQWNFFLHIFRSGSEDHTSQLQVKGKRPILACDFERLSSLSSLVRVIRRVEKRKKNKKTSKGTQYLLTDKQGDISRTFKSFFIPFLRNFSVRFKFPDFLCPPNCSQISVLFKKDFEYIIGVGARSRKKGTQRLEVICGALKVCREWLC